MVPKQSEIWETDQVSQCFPTTTPLKMNGERNPRFHGGFASIFVLKGGDLQVFRGNILNVLQGEHRADRYKWSDMGSPYK